MPSLNRISPLYLYFNFRAHMRPQTAAVGQERSCQTLPVMFEGIGFGLERGTAVSCKAYSVNPADLPLIFRFPPMMCISDS